MSAPLQRGQVLRSVTFVEGELAELLDVLLMLSAAPVARESNSGLKLRDLVVGVLSLAPWTKGHTYCGPSRPPCGGEAVNLPNNY